MHSRVTARRPAGCPVDERAVRCVTEDDVASRGLHLRVAFDAEVCVALVEELLREGAVRRVAGDATFAQSLMAEDVRLALLAVTVGTRLVQAREREAALGLVDVEAVCVVALAAVEFAFEDLMMMRQAKFRVRLDVAGKASLRSLARVHNELVPPLPTGLDMLTTRSVARLASGLSCKARTVGVEAPVCARSKGAGVVRMAVGARLIADECRAFDLRRSGDRTLDGGAGAEAQADARSDEQRRGRQPAEDAFAIGGHGQSVP